MGPNNVRNVAENSEIKTKVVKMENTTYGKVENHFYLTDGMYNTLLLKTLWNNKLINLFNAIALFISLLILTSWKLDLRLQIKRKFIDKLLLVSNLEASIFLVSFNYCRVNNFIQL